MKMLQREKVNWVGKSERNKLGLQRIGRPRRLGVWALTAVVPCTTPAYRRSTFACDVSMSMQ